MKPSTCGINSTDLMIQLCAIRLYQIGCNYRLLEIISILVIEISAKNHIGATLLIICCTLTLPSVLFNQLLYSLPFVTVMTFHL